MLEDISAVDRQYVLCRFAAQPKIEQMLKEDDVETIDLDMVFALVQQHHAEEYDPLLDGPFDLGQRSKSRYTDATFPVFYASIEVETALAEVKHWLRACCKSPTASTIH